MKHIYQLFAGFLLLVLLTACEKDTEAGVFAPEVTTGAATDIYRKGATLSGSIEVTENTMVDRYGILFSELQSMAEYDEMPITTGETDFSLPVQNLEPGETYYFCTYAHSGYSMVRGEVRSFTTSQSNAPVFTTPVSSDESQSSFTVTATLLDDGGSELMLSGFCYNEAGEDAPTFMDNVVNLDMVGDAITAAITGLEPNNTYQVRAYGASKNGLAYSEMIMVTTGAAVVPVTTIKIVEENSDRITVQFALLDSGSAKVTEGGICLSTTYQEPTIEDKYLYYPGDWEAGTAFEGVVENLSPGTTYYLRSYAVNEYGTGYSETITYATPEIAEVAYLCNGSTFNERIKQLANGKAMRLIEKDSLIQKIEFKTGVMSRSSGDYVEVGATDSNSPIYASFNQTDGLLTVSTPSNKIEIVDASYLFNRLISMHTIDLGNFRISEATTNMEFMCDSCVSLTSLNVSDWNTSKVTNMNSAFDFCRSLKTLDPSNWDTSSVVDMTFMLWGCESLTSLDLSKWNTSKVVRMSSVFGCCFNMSSLNVSTWDTSNVTNMSSVFDRCTSLEALDVSKWNTANAVEMGWMFANCHGLTDIDVSNWNTSNVNGMQYMFNGCSLKSLDLSKWDTSKVTDMSYMFLNCSDITKLDISNWTLNESANYANMFNHCAVTSQACEIAATQAAQDFLLGITETTRMEPSYFIWVNANAGSGNSFEDMPNQDW